MEIHFYILSSILLINIYYYFTIIYEKHFINYYFNTVSFETLGKEGNLELTGES